jgi:mannosyltransferase
LVTPSVIVTATKEVAPAEPLSSVPATPAPRWETAAIVGAVLAVAVGVGLRFWTRSALWLDEALTVNVARLPLGQIAPALRHDGAPPLYYYLLHFWMEAFGTSDLAVRSMGAAFSVASIPLAWLAGRRIGGRRTAWVAALFFATSPFAVRFATEARMYSLVIFLVLVGYLALAGALEERRPSAWRLVVLALVSGLLLLTHYWALYLVGALVILLVGRAALANDDQRDRCLRAAAALVGGGLLFVPWIPVFVYQTLHTGTPWADPPSFSATVNAVSEFAGSKSSAGRALGLTFFALAGLGLMGRALDARSVELDLRTRPAGRGVALITALTLLLAMVAGFAARSAFAARYIAVVFPPFILLVALGTEAFSHRRVRAAVVAAAVLFGLLSCTENVRTTKTQAPELAAALRAGVRPGDVIGYCPDQLGPAVSRLLPANLDQVTFPRQTGPRFVDWVNYAKTNQAGDPVQFVTALDARAGVSHSVWLVWAPGYRTYRDWCEQIEGELGALRPGSSQVVTGRPLTFFEHANLTRYPPVTPQ